MQKNRKELKESEDLDFWADYVKNRGEMIEAPSTESGEPAETSTVSDDNLFDKTIQLLQCESRKELSSNPGNLVPRVKSLRSNKDLYEVMSRGDQCFFCDNTPTNTFYRPLLKEISCRGPHGEMKAYKVCITCAGRLDKNRSMSLEEFTNYVTPLVARGSVGGRIAHKSSNALREAAVRIQEDYIAEAHNNTFRLIEGSIEKVVYNVVNSNGEILLFIRPC